MNTTTPSHEFLAAFAAAAQINPDDAGAQWAAWSRCLTESERSRVEAGGAASGTTQGKLFRCMEALEGLNSAVVDLYMAGVITDANFPLFRVEAADAALAAAKTQPTAR